MRKYEDLRIVFMGTPDFAVASLDRLVQSGANIVGVVTAPDKPAGRGMKLSQSAVKVYAEAHGLHILQPEKLRAPEFLEELQSLNADLQLVVAFRMLPEVVWNMPPLGTINLHGSLLPKYRGAAPINWAVINGDKETGVTTFQLKQEIDTGDILMREKMSISAEDNAGDVHDRMMQLGADVLVKTVQEIAKGTLVSFAQSKIEEDATPAPKLNTQNCEINWQQPVYKVYNLIRGLAPFPGAYTRINGKLFKIYAGEMLLDKPTEPAGTSIVNNKGELLMACDDGYYKVHLFQPEGKKRMKPEEYLRGNKI